MQFCFFVICLLFGPFTHATTDIVIISELPYNFSVASALIWTEAAFDLAIEAANAKYAPFLNVSLQLFYNNSHQTCSDLSDDTVARLAKFRYKETNTNTVYALVSSICTDQAGIESVATGWDWLLFSPALAQDDFLSNDVSPTAMAIGGTFYSYAQLVVRIAERFGWRYITMLKHVDSLSPFYINIARSLWAQMNNVSAADNCSFDLDNFNFKYTDRSMRNGLNYAKTRSRVVIILAAGKIALEILLMAEDLGLANGEFVFINVQPLQQGGFGEISLFNHPKTQNLTAFRSFIFIAYRSSGSELQALNDKLLARTKLLNPGADTGYDGNSQPLDSFAVEATFDLVDILALVVNGTVSEKDRSERWSGRHLADLMSNRTFSGLTTGDLVINAGGERMLEMDIYRFDVVTMGMKLAGRYIGSSGSLIWPNRTVNWPTADGRPPPDVPVCGFSGLTGPCTPPGTSLRTVLVPLFILLAVTFGLLCYAWYAHRPPPREWLIKQHEILYRRLSDLSRSGQSQSSGNAKWRGQPVWTKVIPLNFAPSKESLDGIIRPLACIQHLNINTLIGLSLLETQAIIVTDYCKHGSISELFHEMHLNWDFKLSLISDLVDGLYFIHKSLDRAHGHLQAKVCLVDSRFTLRISSLGFDDIVCGLTKQPIRPPDSLWTPLDTRRSLLARESDIFALGILIVAISIQGEPTRNPATLLRCAVEIPAEVPSDLRIIATNCTSHEPETWPKISAVKRALDQIESMDSIKGQKIVDRVWARYSTYTANLETAVRERSEELNRERLKCDEILQSMLPAFVVARLRANRMMPPEYFDFVSICFSDLVGFVNWVSTVSPYQVLDMLSLIYAMFDGQISCFNVQKIEAIGDSYMIASGIPVKTCNDPHAAEICRMAVALMRNFKENEACQHGFLLRIGIHSGSCAAGVIGTKIPRYCLFGDAVNIASRMMTHGQGSRIHISLQTVAMLDRDIGEFSCEPRGLITLKGKGPMKTYWLGYHT